MVTMPLNGRLTGPQGQSGSFRQEKTLLSPTIIKPKFLGRLFCCVDYFENAVKMVMTDLKASQKLTGMTEKRYVHFRINVTECRGWVVKILALYSGDLLFETEWIIPLLTFFVIFLSSSRQMVTYHCDCLCPQLSDDNYTLKAGDNVWWRLKLLWHVGYCKWFFYHWLAKPLSHRH